MGASQELVAIAKDPATVERALSEPIRTAPVPHDPVDLEGSLRAICRHWAFRRWERVPRLQILESSITPLVNRCGRSRHYIGRKIRTGLGAGL